MKLTNQAILILILGFSALLRFYRFPEIPYMHDEFSALFRTDFETFRDLIDNGVRPDGHPAGIQVFLYFWVKLVGKAEWLVKLPFTIMGLLSVLLVYLVSRKWYNETVSLICAAYFATLQYTIMYSQIARPYISGLFFSLAMVYFWAKLPDSSSKKFWKNGIFFVLASALSAYNHHFSLLFAAIVGLSGLFFIPRKFIFRYILLGMLIFVLYIPHLKIFLYQLGTGGVGGWLAKPETSFFPDYIYYIFNFSLLSVLLVLVLMLFGYIHINKSSLNLSYYLLFSLWFLLPLAIGYWYSVNFSPVLQYSVLLFSFFPLLFILFGHIPKFPARINILLISAVLVVNSYSLIFGRKHYDIFYKSPYEHIVKNYAEAKRNNTRIVSIIDSHKKITPYYLNKHKVDSAFTWFDEFPDEASFSRFLKEKSNTSDYLYFGALSSNKPNTLPIIRQYFPAILKQKNYFGASTWLFSKTEGNLPGFVTVCTFRAPVPDGWQPLINEYIVTTEGFDDNYSYLMDSLYEWSPTYSVPVSQLITHENNYIDISADVKNDSDFEEVLLVATLETEGEVHHFSAADFKSFKDSDASSNEWFSVHHSLKLADYNLDYEVLWLKVFVWNKSKESILLDNIRVGIRDGNPIMYGLYEKIP